MTDPCVFVAIGIGIGAGGIVVIALAIVGGLVVGWWLGRSSR